MKKKPSKRKNTGKSDELLKTSRALIKERDLGLTENTCRVCGATGQYQTYLVREMMIPTRDEFEYFACGNCGCLQIREIPNDIGKYYGQGYYSYGTPPDLLPPEGTPVKTEMILDVGCGAGQWLCTKAYEGYVNAYGCDPFIEKDIHYNNGVQIRRCSIHEMTGSFDYIRLHHSFEHMSDPHEVMQSIKRLLKPGGLCQISIPVFPNMAFAIYGPFWFQVDAPRHFILHSKESFVYTANGAGLDVVAVEYNAKSNQFFMSRLYQLDIPLMEQTNEILAAKISAEDLEKMEIMTKIANEEHTGDMATFDLQHQVD